MRTVFETSQVFETPKGTQPALYRIIEDQDGNENFFEVQEYIPSQGWLGITDAVELSEAKRLLNQYVTNLQLDLKEENQENEVCDEVSSKRFSST